MIRFIATFSSFTISALNEINKDTVLINKLKNNLNILKNINGISDKLNSIDKNFMDSSLFVFEIDKENKDALDMMNSKVNNILESKDNQTSKKFIDNIVEYASQFKDISAITGEIYETIEYIKNITNKTNLLSINAGIQSSKAGVYGKSFSVVAKEIGNLSNEISLGTQSIEKILINIFSGLVMVENSSFYVEEHCEIIKKSVQKITEEIDNYLKIIENDMSFESSNIDSFEALENFNNKIFELVEEQNDIVSYIRENINAMLDIQNQLNSKIDFQNQDIIKIFNNFNNVIENRERLNGAIKKVGNYSSMSHTNIEALSNIINTHKMKSSITFAPIIALLKSSKIR